MLIVQRVGLWPHYQAKGISLCAQITATDAVGHVQPREINRLYEARRLAWGLDEACLICVLQKREEELVIATLKYRLQRLAELGRRPLLGVLESAQDAMCLIWQSPSHQKLQHPRPSLSKIGGRG